MIEFLKISSLAIFEELEVEFLPGLNCITGETGAGKSLVLDALTLLMGARAGRELIRPQSDKTTIEALFSVSGREVVLRRELHASGSNRCYIDDKLVSASQLSEVSSGIIHIYGQHEYQDLLSPKQHMRILEELAGIRREGVLAAYDAYTRAREHLLELETRIESFQQDQEYLEYCLRELEATPLEVGLEERLTHDLETASAAAELKMSALATQDLIYSGSRSMTDLSAEARQHISRLVSHDKSMEPVLCTMDTIIALLEDADLALRQRISSYEHDPERIVALEEQLNGLRELKRKHRMDEAGLLKLRGDIQTKLALLDNSGQNTAQARVEVEEALRGYRAMLLEFIGKRKVFSQGLCTRITRDLKDLGMTETQFTLQQLDTDALDDALIDAEGAAVPPSTLLRGEFLISTNVGQNLLPLVKIASGGELSRIMLAIKVQQKALNEATLVFDEIDSGISGQTAFAIAGKLKELSKHAQSIVVTHLHQVASVADSHFVITKQTSGKSTTSTLHRVRSMDRVMELARMMGGDSPSTTVIEHAKELVHDHEGRAPQ
ncbi:MAG TPA: DNA repair protein RecN [Deltaproteobacteria bacterium]|nr:DNA repair protein RecN [Deltaproteobacteria bacterium]